MCYFDNEKLWGEMVMRNHFYGYSNIKLSTEIKFYV